MGGVDIFVHKYIGPPLNTNSKDSTQPAYDQMDPTNIQDLLFLENRDRKYDPDIYRMRMHYTIQDNDFDLSQFGLFLSNDILFLTVHYNDMIDILGRKIIVGDVLELPHLTDYHPLNETIPIGLRRYYQVTDGNYASIGFSQTWLPHIWRLKIEPLTNTQEFADILDKPTDQDNYMGAYDKTKGYPKGYKIDFGGKNYIATKDVPAGKTPPDSEYWQPDTASTLTDLLSSYNKNLAINDAVIKEAERQLPKSGYNVQNLYVVPTDEKNEPALPKSVVIGNGAPTAIYGTIDTIRAQEFNVGSPVIRLPYEALRNFNQSTGQSIQHQILMSLEMAHLQPERIGNSGRISGDDVLIGRLVGPVTGPYGTADNWFATADQNIDLSGFDGTSTEQMDYLADCDPRFRYVTRSSPKSFGYLDGYLIGDGNAPNGLPLKTGDAFPSNAKKGDYFLRIDYKPQVLFRFDGKMWVKISQNVRTGFGFGTNDQSQLSTFINNTNTTELTDGGTMAERQSLSTILTIKPD